MYLHQTLRFDGIFKFWLANAINYKSKLNFSTCCNYGVTKYSDSEKIEVKLSDNFS